MEKTWCIAKPSASNEILAQNLDYECSEVSCAVIQKGGPCYYPDSPVSRAAVAMNLYYAYSGRHPLELLLQQLRARRAVRPK
uniref:X8 domain-containing protein n=1 Tax=Zea mays TaxID=4577 RepID=A0A804MHL0_MAIZE